MPQLVQTELDHTPDSGVRCFLTANKTRGLGPDVGDVDGGKITLTSPVIDLSGCASATLRYWKWYTNDEIQSVIDNYATAGDTVEVQNGTYAESVDVNKAITLSGQATLTGSLTVSAAGAVVSPGFSEGSFSSTDLTFGADTTYQVDLGGDTVPSEYDQLIASAAVTINAAAFVSP